MTGNSLLQATAENISHIHILSKCEKLFYFLTFCAADHSHPSFIRLSDFCPVRPASDEPPHQSVSVYCGSSWAVCGHEWAGRSVCVSSPESPEGFSLFVWKRKKISTWTKPERSESSDSETSESAEESGAGVSNVLCTAKPRARNLWQDFKGWRNNLVILVPG